ncbi:MAG: aldehyde dehydrogenase family protein [Sphaerochaeta sp.]|nr:aldehyde dehydrogenase family protein [Sphaerochaeta sp.]
MIDTQFFIGGELLESSTNRRVEVTCPATNKTIGTIPLGNAEDAHHALTKATMASKEWALLPAQTRAGFIVELADIMEEGKEELAKILSLEQGKIINEARGEVGGAIGFLRYAAESARRIEANILDSEIKDERIWIERVPYGVTVGLLAWNFPLALMARKVGNALVTGNCMVVKPPTETPLTVMRYGEMLVKSSLPKGVLNFITGTGREVGNALVSDKLTKLVTLTGSTGAGRQLYKAAAENITVLRLELGGKAPFIVMDDANVDKAVQCAVVARFTNCGQICTCNERMYIHEAVYDEFSKKFIAEVKKLKVGDSFDPEASMGPKVNKAEIEKLENMIQKSIAQGSRILYDGSKEAYVSTLLSEYPDGNWFFPQIVEVSDNKNILMQEETFGPVAPMMKIGSFEEALEYANDCEYGLSAYLFTNNAKNIMRMTRELEFGEVYVNRENRELINGFHNGFKLSGIGGEDGKFGLEGYLQKKTIYMNYDI